MLRSSTRSKLNRQIENDKVLRKAWMTKCSELEHKLAESFGDKNADQFHALLKSKDQEILSLRAKLNLAPTEHADSADLIAAAEEKEKLVAEKLKLQQLNTQLTAQVD
jgi:succinate dehydrogenase flavin-adding protein (antitoxin of CptAB toxin-antitoxin module)